MKNFIQTLRNIWNIEELRLKILITLGFIAIYRFGSYLVLPGIDPIMVDAINSSQTGTGGLFGLINQFSGGAFMNASIFALGLMPYISASIAMQLLTLAVPAFQKMQKEGESGRRQINQYTRILTIAVTLVQGIGYVTYLRGTYGEAITIASPMLFNISTIIILSAGTLFVMWLGERITDKGLGNGISLLIMVGIIANLPSALLQEFGYRGQTGGIIIFIIEMAVLVLVVIGTILLVQGTRRIPVQYAKRNIVKGGRMMQAGGVRQYLPVKVNAAGVMPIIFAQALMFLPSTVVQVFDLQGGFWNNLADPFNIWNGVMSFFLVVLFTYFYTALTINPVQIADELKKNGGFIPGVKPGRKTAEFIDNVVSRITLPGSIFLGIVAILPIIARQADIQPAFALFYGGTSLLILVAVVLDTLQQIESHLLMRQYDGLTKSGRIKGRQGSIGAGI
jgi:preprotein translocase subunit SecY